MKAIIVAARRTPIGRKGGSLAHLPVAALAAPVIRAVIADAGLDPAAIDDVILGNAAGPGGNVARLALLEAGLPVTVPGLTVDRQCGSGLEAINLACRLVEAGAGEAYLAGGVESTSTAPWRLARPQHPFGTPRLYERAPFAPAAIGDPEMGEAAENVARVFGIDRGRQDRYALGSHLKAVAAAAAGRFAAELVPLAGAAGGLVDADECPRRDTSLDALSRLPPAFVAGGSVTAGNACPLNDGAAVVAVVSEHRWRAAGAPPALAFVDAAAGGVDPNLLGTGPIAAVRRLAARRPGSLVAAIDIVEFNEAFAAQVLACLDALGIAEERVSVAGGAIALGHPFGASGAILVCRLFSELVDNAGGLAVPPRTGLATLGIAGGLGLASLFERR